MWVHWLCSKTSLHLHVESQIPGIPACHFRWIVSVNPTDSIYDLINFLFGEAMLKDPEPTSHSEWGGGGGGGRGLWFIICIGEWQPYWIDLD